MLFTLQNRIDVLVDDYKLPRYWAAVWVIFHGGGIAPSTLRIKLGYIDSLYVHAESLDRCLDDALSTLDFESLSLILESFFVKMRNVSKPISTNTSRWNTAYRFIKDTTERLENNPAIGNKMADIRQRMARLDNLYLGLRPYRKTYKTEIRALPRNVLLEVLEAATPGSQTNPFEYEETQWRVYAAVALMLFQGLRVGEIASLPANFVKSEIDIRTGKHRWYMAVETGESEDPRYSKPSIKTTSSIRTIPLTQQTARIMQTYQENYRGKTKYKQFLMSMHKKPFSKEGMRNALYKLSGALTPTAREQLLNITGALQLTGHALRHTCAVIRMRQWSAQGQTPERAMQHMRSFFGWSRNSLMPMLYAKAALDEQRNDTWNDELDDRLAILRSMPL